MASQCAVIVAALCASPDQMLLLPSGSYLYNDTYVLAGTNAVYWPTGQARRVTNNLYMGYGWDTYPGGIGALTVQMQDRPARRPRRSSWATDSRAGSSAPFWDPALLRY